MNDFPVPGKKKKLEKVMMICVDVCNRTNRCKNIKFRAIRMACMYIYIYIYERLEYAYPTDSLQRAVSVHWVRGLCCLCVNRLIRTSLITDYSVRSNRLDNCPSDKYVLSLLSDQNARLLLHYFIVQAPRILLSYVR